MAKVLEDKEEKTRGYGLMERFTIDIVLGGLGMFFFALGLYMAFYVAPLQIYTGLPWWSQKIFYVHVPAAWGALVGLFIVMFASIAYLITQREKWDILAVSAAEPCFIFATLVMITGPLWAKPSWNIYWKWEDPRLMSFFALWLILGAYFLLRNYGGSNHQMRSAAAALGIMGAVAVPFVFLSIKFGRSFHPDPGKFEMSRWVALTVLVCSIAFMFLFLLFLRLRYRLEAQRNALRHLRLQIQEID